MKIVIKFTGRESDTEAKLTYEGDNIQKVVIFKNCVLFTDCIAKINNAPLDIAKDLHVIML